MIKGLEARPSETEELMIDTLARAEERLSKSDGYCADVDSTMLPTINELLANSLTALNPHQKTILAMLRADGEPRRLNQVGLYSEVGTYILPQVIADNNYEFLRAGYDAQNSLALEGLILVHAPGSAIMSQGVALRLPNPRLFLKFALLYAQLHGPDALGPAANRLVVATLSTMGPTEQQKLRLEVELEARKWRMPSSGSEGGAGSSLSEADRPLDRFPGCEE
jgi:hypothetical protein